MHENLLHEGDGQFCRNIVATHKTLHSGNVLCTRFHPDGTRIATGGGDKCVCVLEEYTEHMKFTQYTPHSSAVLDVDWHPSRPSILLTTSTDRSHAIVDTSHDHDHEHDDNNNGVVQMFKDHQKFVSRGRWCPRGDVFVTTSYDSTVNLYGRDNEDSEYTLQHRINFAEGPIEGLGFLNETSCV